MNLRFWSDPETGLPHILTHGVNEQEVLQIMLRPAEEFPGREDSRIRLGQTLAGRCLQVVFVPDPGGMSAFVVTAYDITSKARRAFRSAPKEEKEMSKTKKQQLPRGWTQERVRKLAEFYDNQSEDDQAAEHAAALRPRGRPSWLCPPSWCRRSAT